jgi:hypothetical protein
VDVDVNVDVDGLPSSSGEGAGMTCIMQEGPQGGSCIIHAQHADSRVAKRPRAVPPRQPTQRFPRAATLPSLLEALRRSHPYKWAD